MTERQEPLKLPEAPSERPADPGFHRRLGPGGPLVSRLCFGSLTMGPLQAKKTPVEAGRLMAQAYRMGVNFFDTAELYGTYPHLRAMLSEIRLVTGAGRMGGGGEANGCGEFVLRPVIASKAYVHTAGGARRSLEKALDELGLERIDIFLLHEIDSPMTLRGHMEALDYLHSLCDGGGPRTGRLGWTGVSTHSPRVVRAAALEPKVLIIHAIVNQAGLGVVDGTLQDMLDAVAFARTCGKGLYAMKALGGGHLQGQAEEAIRFAATRPGVDAVAVGIQDENELRFNLAVLRDEAPDPAWASSLAGRRRRLHVEDWCTGCGTCAEQCTHNAIAVDPGSGRAAALSGACVFCGYCAARCPEFAIRVL